MDIRFVPQEEIDKTKWNSCIHYATNGNIFGYMWYLNNVAKEWDALVEDDYKSVFPLIWRYKYLKIKELYQPDLMRESGIYSINTLSQVRINAFINAIPKDIKYANIHLNERNQLPPSSDYKITDRRNHQLLLTDDYDKLTQHYSPSLAQKIEKAVLSNLVATSNVKPEKLVDFYKKHTTNRKNLDRRYHGYLRIMYNLLHRGWGFASGILDSKGEELLATAFLVYSHHKVMVLLSAASPEGKQKAADAYLIDMLLRTHAGKPSILDFNSEDEVAFEFGAKQNVYQNLVFDKRKWGIL